MRPEITRYLAACEARGHAKKTLSVYRYHLDAFDRSTDKPPADVTPEDIEDFLIASGHLSPVTRRVRRATIHGYFGYLHARGHVPGNPVAAVPAPRIPRRRPTYYEPEAVARLLASCGDPRDRLLLCILLRHGQRINGVLALPWSAVDLERALIRYPSAKGGRPLTLGLDLDTAKQLKAWRALVSGPWVFPGYKGGHLNYARAHTILRNACRTAGLPWRGAHEFRRTCITTLLQMGEPLHVVSEKVAGHADVTTTARFYAGVDEEDVGKMIRRLPY